MHRALSITIVALLLAIAGCTGTSSKFDSPKVDLVGLEPAQSGSGQAHFLVKLRVVNPNDVVLGINGVYYEISVDGHELFTGASDQKSEIPAYGEGVISLRAAPSLFGTIGLFKGLISGAGKQGAINYSLYTKISVAGRMMPLRINHSGKLDLAAASKTNSI